MFESVLFELWLRVRESVTNLIWGFGLLWFDLSDYLFKLLLIGDSSVGKNCMLVGFAVSHHSVHFHLSCSCSPLPLFLCFVSGWLLCRQLRKDHWIWFRNYHSSSSFVTCIYGPTVKTNYFYFIFFFKKSEQWSWKGKLSGY